MAEHYGTAIIPARVRTPKDKPNAEGTVRNISIWITAALRNEQFFSLAELNRAIREKLEQFNRRLFQKKEGSRLDLFLEDENPLPATRFELSDWKTATVQFNYHISVDGMLYYIVCRCHCQTEHKTKICYAGAKRIRLHDLRH